MQVHCNLMSKDLRWSKTEPRLTAKSGSFKVKRIKVPEICSHMLIKTKQIHKENMEVSDGIGFLEWPQHIQIDYKVTPIVNSPRKVPIAQREKLKQELEHMEKLLIIIKVDEPTMVVNNMVIVTKSMDPCRFV